jgi:uncharacterized OsmC-like protein
VKLTILADDRIRYEPTTGPLTVEAPTAETIFSPFHMLGGSLAACTYTTLASWAEHAKLTFADLAIEVAWTFAEKPHRVGTMSLELIWPSLPAPRLEAARRAAALCTVHQTLHHPPELTTIVNGAAPVATPRPVETPAAAPTPAPSAGAA